jgi:hypothetical protein
MQKSLLITFMLLPLVGAKSTVAYADNFDIVAGGCVPDSTTLKQNKYIVVDGTIFFKPGVTGALQFHCAVPKLSSGPILLVLRYKSPGTSDVFISYIKGSKAIVAPPSFSEVARFPDLNNPVTHQNSYTISTATISDAYSSASNIYWVKLEMSRSSATDEVALYSATLH